MESKHPFIYKAVKGTFRQDANENSLDQPVQSLPKIVDELGTESSGAVFVEFSKRRSIYGFDDLQVKRLFDEIKNNR